MGLQWRRHRRLQDRWAHESGDGKNEELIDYFKDRTVWLFEADENPPKLRPYGAAPANSPSTPSQAVSGSSHTKKAMQL